MRQLFNDGWQFLKRDIDSPAVIDTKATWTAVEIPHDWLIYNTQKLYENGEGLYRKMLKITEANLNEKCVFLRFDGVYMDSTIHINGKEAFQWKNGYTAFEFECTSFLNVGDNEILVKVVYRSPNSRWYSGAGIYRNVYIDEKNKYHFITDGIYISPQKLDENRWVTEIEVETNCNNGIVSHTLEDKDGNVFASATGGQHVSVEVSNPLLWDIDSPNLYIITSSLTVNNEIVDTIKTRFGFRTVEMTTDKGFFLNGRHMKLQGVCLHHDLGALGAAFNKDAMARQMRLLKEMGANAIRTAHNPPAEDFMCLADEMGFLVVSELLDCWKRPKTQYDYARFFDEWIEKDVTSWVRRDRNCPSLFMWSIGNEIYDTHQNEEGQETLKMLMVLTKKHDPKGHGAITIGSNYMPWENTQKCADIIKLIGYNYATYLYEKHHTQHPDWIIYGSETCSTVQSRGIYHFPLSRSILADDDLECSSLGNSSTSWGAKNLEECIISDRDAEFSLGQFIWSGIDYIGEPTPYFTKNSYFGQMDTACFKKDSYYVFQSAWTDYKKAPMVHILPYWDFSMGQLIDVRVCSNAPRFELFFNNKSLGTFDIDHKNGKKLIGDWRIPYENGELKAYAYDENGNVIATDTKCSFGDSYSIELLADKMSIPVNKEKLVFIEISVRDKNGFSVENACDRIAVTVSGGRLLGLDNGDSADFDQYKVANRRLFSGKLLAIVSPLDEESPITVTAQGKNLVSKSITIQTSPAENAVNKAFFSTIEPSSVPDEIPVRKIQLTSSSGMRLSPSYTTTVVTACILPANADYRELVWRVTDSGGIDSPLASIVEEKGDHIIIAAKGDGIVYVRCGTKNGRDHLALISQIAISIDGIGKPFLDPYSFVSGGLYNLSNLEMTNGNDRGVATLRDGVSHVGFEGLDFGSYGSDEITLPLFPLNPEPFPIEIWEGMPNHDGKHITTVTYNKGSKWNTYQEETYKLPIRLKGVTTLCLVFKQKVHIKGFIFKKYDKAFEKIYAAENDAVYGDSFVTNENYVEGIGNNVSLIYNDMDFGTRGASSIELCSASKVKKNSVQIIFAASDGSVIRKMIEVEGSIEYKSAVYNLGEVIDGAKKVSFVFLPGCDIDLAWFRFL